jgi:hypothetical protein
MTEKKRNEAVDKEKELAELRAYLEQKEAELDAREKALAEKGPSMAAAPQKRPLSKDEQKLIDDGCKAYGIDMKYLLSSGIDPQTGEAILLTSGGKKVRYQKGMGVEPLSPVEVDGISRKKPRHLMGKKK